MSSRFEAFLDALAAGTETTDPEPVEMCQICPWWRSCDKLWHDEDRLNLVPGLGRGHRNELQKRGVDAVVALAKLGDPLPFRLDHGSREAYLSSAHQAQMQMETRKRNEVAFELLPIEEGQGLTRLPEPSEHDLFLDLEGHPFFGTGGLEYLWGWRDASGAYEHAWALDRVAEERAAERFIDLVKRRHAEHPAMHIYHYGSYEEGALKRLSTRHATREDELDALLRANVFVDLQSITQQAARIGVESYSLKDLERVHSYVRDADLLSVSPHKRTLEDGLILGT